MTTSAVTAWAMTVNDIVKAAMEESGLIDPGTDPEADELATGIRQLNGLLKSWQTRGVILSREQTLSVVTTPATAFVTLNAAVRAISSARLVVSATNERRLWPIDRTRYFNLPNKDQVGTPSLYYLDRQRDAAVLYLWPVSATAVTVKLDYDRIADTVTAGTETIDLRSELQETVWTNLGVKMCRAFGQPVPETLMADAMRLEVAMYDAERPDSYHFETDYDYA
jgi:hypothetical protein